MKIIKPLPVSKAQKELLERIIRQNNCPQSIVRRANIILAGATGLNSVRTAEKLNIDRETTSLWRSRWIEVAPKLSVIEKSKDKDAAKQLDRALRSALKDAPRSGGPSKFTTSQNAQIIAIACEDPKDPKASNRPIDFWTNRELADEAIKRGIVSSISGTHVGRFLKRSQLKTT
jgi:putative transposase